mgnify:FL=1
MLTEYVLGVRGIVWTFLPPNPILQDPTVDLVRHKFFLTPEQMSWILSNPT